MSSVKQSQGWGKLLCLFFLLCSRLNLLQDKLLLLSCVIQEN
ncbi:hypothetical protein CsSME_00052448 [Camellia sinensis var. sinensis]